MKFKLNMEADCNMTSLQGYVELFYCDIVDAFGAGDGDGDKTTQEWTFESDSGEVFTLYDWKMDNTPTDLYRWHIGGHGGKGLSEFIAWLKKTVGA